MQFDFRVGTYKVINPRGLNVRGTMDTTIQSNLIGQAFTIGKTLPVFKINVEKNGWIWGEITPSTAYVRQTLYVCIWDLNTVFAELVVPFDNDMSNPVLSALLRIESKLDELLRK